MSALIKCFIFFFPDPISPQTQLAVCCSVTTRQRNMVSFGFSCQPFQGRIGRTVGSPHTKHWYPRPGLKCQTVKSSTLPQFRMRVDTGEHSDVSLLDQM